MLHAPSKLVMHMSYDRQNWEMLTGASCIMLVRMRSQHSCGVILALWQDPKTGEEHDVVISKDDGVRPGTTAAGLAKLRAVFKKDGSTTAGNSSQVRSCSSASLLVATDILLHLQSSAARCCTCGNSE